MLKACTTCMYMYYVCIFKKHISIALFVSYQKDRTHNQQGAVPSYTSIRTLCMQGKHCYMYIQYNTIPTHGQYQ